MAISGSLEDVSVADVVQFIHLGRRTGALMLRRDGEDVRVGFHQGKLVSAQSRNTPRLGALLVAEGVLEMAQLESAIEAQRDEEKGRSLGQILLARELVQAEDLRRVVGQQIEQTISELVGWERGSFEFVVDDRHPVDDIALYPGDVVPDSDINTQMVLLEAARIFDERNRDAGSESLDETKPSAGRSPGVPVALEALVAAPPAEVAEPPSETEVDVHRLQIVTADDELAHALDRALPPGFAPIEPVGVAIAGKALPYHEAPLVLLDLRDGRVSVEELARMRRIRAGAPLVALVAAGTATGPIYEAGAIATLPPEVDAIVACVENLARNRGRSALGAGLTLPDEAHPMESAGIERLRRVFGDLRSGLISATVALNLMHIISESVERAVLFLVKRDALTALGAFGDGANGRPLAELTRGVSLALSAENALSACFASAEVVTAPFETGAPAELVALLGRPANGKVVAFPVLGAHRVISVIYTDNGENDSPIEDIDILELATAQVGMAFENELLRRQISQQS